MFVYTHTHTKYFSQSNCNEHVNAGKSLFHFCISYTPERPKYVKECDVRCCVILVLSVPIS
jgi:hypothetical protein